MEKYAIAKKDFEVCGRLVWTKGEKRAVVSLTKTKIMVKGHNNRGLFGWTDLTNVELID